MKQQPEDHIQQIPETNQNIAEEDSSVEGKHFEAQIDHSSDRLEDTSKPQQ